MWEMWWRFSGTYINTFFYFMPFGVYYYFFFVRMGKAFGIKKRVWIVRTVSAFVTLFLMLWGLNKWLYGRIVFKRWIGFIISTDIVYLIIWSIKKLRKDKSDGKFYQMATKIWKLGIVPCVLIIGLTIFGYYNMYHVVRTNYTIETKKTLSKDYTIVGISDLHYGISLDVQELKRICDEISDIGADAIVLPGDIVDESTIYKEMLEAVEILGGIRSKYGTFYVFGNHDKNRYVYGREPYYSVDELIAAMEKAGINVMIDDSITINDEFTIVGRDEDEAPQSGGRRKSIDELMSDVDAANFILLLEHKPGNRNENAKAGVDLQISGHTHGGDAYTKGFINKLLGKQYNLYGPLDIGDFKSIVSSGIARWGYTFKTSSPAEYIVVKIKS